MLAPAYARTLTASAGRRWRSLRRRTRASLALLVVALIAATWATSRQPVEPWPSRASIPVGPGSWPLAFSPDGRTLLGAGRGGIIPWDASTGEMGIPWTSPHGLSVKKGLYSPDGRTFAADNSVHPSHGTIELIDPATGRLRATLSLENPTVHNLAFADGGRTLRAFLGDGTNLKEVATWDVATGRRLSSRPLTPPTRLALTAFSPDGRLLAMIPWQGTSVQLWDLEADRSLGTLADPARPGDRLGHGIAFSPDSLTLAVGRSDGAVDFWDVSARKLLRTLPVHPHGYDSIALRFAADGRTFASGGSEAGTTSAFANAVHHLGRKLFGWSRRVESELVVVDLASGRRVVRTGSQSYPIFTPDGRAVATVDDAHIVRVRDLPPPPVEDHRP